MRYVLSTTVNKNKMFGGYDIYNDEDEFITMNGKASTSLRSRHYYFGGLFIPSKGRFGILHHPIT